MRKQQPYQKILINLLLKVLIFLCIALNVANRGYQILYMCAHSETNKVGKYVSNKCLIISIQDMQYNLIRNHHPFHP